LCTDLDYIRLQKRLAKSASQVPVVTKTTEPVENFSDQQELQIVPNHLDHEDEPNVLTATPCLPTNKVPETNGDEIKEELTASSACSVPPHLLKGLLFCILQFIQYGFHISLFKTSVSFPFVLF
jgi:hypothetical protein